MIRQFKVKYTNVKNWCLITNYYMDQLNNRLHNDKNAWNDIFHQRQNQDWWDCVDVTEALLIQRPELFRKYSHFKEDFDDLKSRLQLGKQVMRPMRKDYNQPIYRYWMNFREILNQVEQEKAENKRKIKEILDSTFDQFFEF